MPHPLQNAITPDTVCPLCEQNRILWSHGVCWGCEKLLPGPLPWWARLARWLLR